MSIDVQLNTIRLKQVRAGCENDARAILMSAGAEVQGIAMLRSRVKYGNMKRGWSLAMPGESPSITNIAPAGKLEVIVYNTQNYAIYHELGTRYMSAQPMLLPAIEQVRPRLMSAWGRLL